MKIIMKECTTTIEADAKELRESRTLGDNFTMMLSRAFSPSYAYDDLEEEKNEEEKND